MLLLAESGDWLLRGAACDQRGGTRGAQQPVSRQIVRIGIAGPLACHHTHAAAGAHALVCRLHQRLIKADRSRSDGFEVKICIVAAGGECFSQATFE